MVSIVKQILTSWDNEKNERLKLQRAYFTVTLILAVASGLVTLISPLAGMNILIVAAFVAAVFVTNAISWTVVDLIISKKVSPITKPTQTKKR